MWLIGYEVLRRLLNLEISGFLASFSGIIVFRFPTAAWFGRGALCAANKEYRWPRSYPYSLLLMRCFRQSRSVLLVTASPHSCEYYSMRGRRIVDDSLLSVMGKFQIISESHSPNPLENADGTYKSL